LLGDAVDSHVPRVMRSPKILQAGIAEPDNNKRTRTFPDFGAPGE
jgi:hypothetical protein